MKQQHQGMGQYGAMQGMQGYPMHGMGFQGLGGNGGMQGMMDSMMGMGGLMGMNRGGSTEHMQHNNSKDKDRDNNNINMGMQEAVMARMQNMGMSGMNPNSNNYELIKNMIL